IKTEDIRISSSNEFTFLKINDEIIVYSDEYEIPIALLDSNDGIRLYEFMKQHIGLHSLLLSLFDYKSNNKTWISCLNQITKDSLLRTNKTLLDQLTKDNSLIKKDLPLLFFQNHLFVIVNDSVLKIEIKLDLDINSLSEELKIYEDVENWMAYFGSEKVEEESIIDHFEYVNPFIPNIKVDLTDFFSYLSKQSKSKNIKVKVDTRNEIIGLCVYKKCDDELDWNLVAEYFQKIKYEKEDLAINEVEIFENNDIAILTNIGIFIFKLKDDEISLKYFHYIHYPKENVIKNILGISESYDDKKILKGWVSYLNSDKMGFLKNGSELLKLAIHVHDLKLISDIHKKCLNYFKQDLENNKNFLSIFTMSMPLLKKYYPEYLTRYTLDTNMIIDSLDYKVEQMDHIYICPFSMNIEVINLTRSIWWTKYTEKLRNSFYIMAIQTIIMIHTFPITFSIFLILDHFYIINHIYYDGFTHLYYSLVKSKFSKGSKLSITFMIPYIKFASYPQYYSWWSELIIPQPSPFVESISKDIYKSLNGEALINFKWNSYGKYYYAIIWMGFIALL
ncbi:9116_t:CDS:2, partial [Funneliformis geosporum]